MCWISYLSAKMNQIFLYRCEGRFYFKSYQWYCNEIMHEQYWLCEGVSRILFTLLLIYLVMSIMLLMLLKWLMMVLFNPIITLMLLMRALVFRKKMKRIL